MVEQADHPVAARRCQPRAGDERLGEGDVIGMRGVSPLLGQRRLAGGDRGLSRVERGDLFGERDCVHRLLRCSRHGKFLDGECDRAGRRVRKGVGAQPFDRRRRRAEEPDVLEIPVAGLGVGRAVGGIELRRDLAVMPGLHRLGEGGRDLGRQRDEIAVLHRERADPAIGGGVGAGMADDQRGGIAARVVGRDQVVEVRLRERDLGAVNIGEGAGTKDANSAGHAAELRARAISAGLPLAEAVG
ncbi:hypothetical protein WR25_15859 [Diploscapter pachys]|uniref:Uncharacterized protein n=1 Tax=Diploscapter pachys TaxID=2018661 RepID=A0A2A2M2I3_9BILA|nr:hypothetical protein WR25_15859 [Diploscapter pachys]